MDLSALVLVAALAGQPAQRPELIQPILIVESSHQDAITRGLIWTGVGLHGVDLGVSTYAFGWNRGSGLDRYREANPLLRPFEQNPVGLSVAKMGVAVAANAVLMRYHQRHPTLVRWLAVGQMGLMAWVVVQNAKNIEGIRGGEH